MAVSSSIAVCVPDTSYVAAPAGEANISAAAAATSNVMPFMVPSWWMV